MNRSSKHALILLLAVLLLGLLRVASAQQPRQQQSKHHWDVLYLKNGSVIHGTVLAHDSTNIRMENQVKDTLVYPAQEIAQVVRVPRPLRVSRQGFYGMIEAGAQFSRDEGAVLRAVAGYRFAWQWQAGIGIGLDDYELRSVPVFADIRYDFSRKTHSLFLYAGAGISMPWPSGEQKIGNEDPEQKIPGLYVHAGLGHKIRLRNNNSLHLSAGYSYASMTTKYPIRDWRTGEPLGTYTTYNYSYNRVTITLGYSF
ncbi:LSm family protein [Chitinophaga japonensis]|uniref:Outer membrane protein with beta-barrel domain n=1 Tax=Chitinophaga japonensis TaxID=104662 RepID=A0A562TCZ2_CHIJA|nr:outer membrane beta-barrel protein [Chitinophaga japonensis]TWI91431.1 outer membrane protein with beta-barrel domain [Chitinophaga japonensis]